MFNSSVVDVGIGLIFVYLILGLMCTTVNEWWAQLRDLRAKNLKAGIQGLLPGLADEFYQHALVKSLYEDGRLDEHQVCAFAEAGKFDETNASIAALANVPIGVAETMMVESRTEGVLILAKVSGMSWSTVKAIINMRDDLSGMDPTDLQACKGTYERLRPSTAQQVLRFHRMQQTSTAPSAA